MSYRFTWRNPKILYATVVFLGVSLMSVANVLRLFTTGINSMKMSKSAGLPDIR